VLSGADTSQEALPPRLVARFDNQAGAPFLVLHRVGRGTVLFCATSILPTWNNLAQTNAVALWDHVLRSLIRSTLPRHNFLPQDQLTIPVPLRGLDQAIQLQRPDTSLPPEWIDVGFIQQKQRGVTIRNAWSRGLYRLASQPAPDAPGLLVEDSWQSEIAVNGSAGESDLTPLPASEFQSRIVETGLGQVTSGNTLGAIGSQTRGSALWWWLVLMVFLLLCGELTMLAVGSRQRVAGETS
jgi:hypothetical protein